MSLALGQVAAYGGGLIASGAVSVGIAALVERRSKERQAAAESSNFKRLLLHGRWHAIWESTVHDKLILNHEEVEVRQVRNRLFVHNLARSEDNPEGGYLWRGELRVWDNQHLLGWYVAAEPNVLSKGTMYFVLHPNGNEMEGRWCGRSYDGALITGLCTMARDRSHATRCMKHLVARSKDLPNE